MDRSHASADTEHRLKGPVCGVENCRSRIYEEGEDGYLYCQNGHRKGELLAGEDDEMFETSARTRTRKKSEDKKEKSFKIFKGAKATELYLKSLQLVLRHQLWFLTHEASLPVELETVVKDLWALRIVQFEAKISSQKQAFDSSQTFVTSGTDSEAENRTLSRKSRENKLGENPNLYDCLALCYMGMATLRLPVTPGDIYAWTTDGKLAYRRAIKLLPSAMRDHLPPTYHDVLDPNSLLNLRIFYNTLVDLQVVFQTDYRILWPALNVPVLLFRYLKELALPLELYDAVTRLGEILQYDFALHTDSKTKLGIRHLPEAQLVACIIICVKLFFPFDEKRRYPKTNSEPVATGINWNHWHSVMQRAKQKNRGIDTGYTMEELLKLEEKDVFSMTGGQMDQYLDFYMSNFLDATHIEANDIQDNFRSALHDMFPIASDQPQQTQEPTRIWNADKLEAVRGVHSNMQIQGAVAEDEEFPGLQRPGQGYVYYKKESSLPEPAKNFYEEVARVAGFELDMLILAVFFTEMKIMGRKKKDHEGKNVGAASQVDG